MGCITGLVAKIFLMAFNIAVAIVGLAVLALAAVITAYLNGYGDLIPSEPYTVLVGLQTTASLVMCLGVFGVVVACCCTNKLFLYTHFIVGLCLVITVLTFAGIGATQMNQEEYKAGIVTNMYDDVMSFKLKDQSGENEMAKNEIYSTNECCGVINYMDWKANQANALSLSGKSLLLPKGCCTAYEPENPTALDKCTSKDLAAIYTTGCYTKLEGDAYDTADACVKLSIFFGVFLFALLASTCLCVKCTNAMPI